MVGRLRHGHAPRGAGRRAGAPRRTYSVPDGQRSRSVAEGELPPVDVVAGPGLTLGLLVLGNGPRRGGPALPAPHLPQPDTGRCAMRWIMVGVLAVDSRRKARLRDPSADHSHLLGRGRFIGLHCHRGPLHQVAHVGQHLGHPRMVQPRAGAAVVQAQRDGHAQALGLGRHEPLADGGPVAGAVVGPLAQVGAGAVGDAHGHPREPVAAGHQPVQRGLPVGVVVARGEHPQGAPLVAQVFRDKPAGGSRIEARQLGRRRRLRPGPAPEYFALHPVQHGHQVGLHAQKGAQALGPRPLGLALQHVVDLLALGAGQPLGQGHGDGRPAVGDVLLADGAANGVPLGDDLGHRQQPAGGGLDGIWGQAHLAPPPTGVLAIWSIFPATVAAGWPATGAAVAAGGLVGPAAMGAVAGLAGPADAT